MAIPALATAILSGELLNSIEELGVPISGITGTIGVLGNSFKKLQKNATNFYNIAIQSNRKLQDQIRSGSTVLASQLDLYDQLGSQVDDFGTKIDALIPKVATLQKELEKRTADIAGATTKVTNEVLNQILINFNTVQGQSKEFASDFEAITELATKFVSVISTFQIPEFQIPQEVRSVLQGDINNINTLIARQTALSKSEFELARARGEAVDFLIESFDAFGAAQIKFRGSLTNSLSILEDIFDQVRREAGKPLFDATETGIAAFTNVIETQGLLFREIFEDSTKRGVIFGDTAQAIENSFIKISDAVEIFLKQEGELVTALDALDFILSEFISAIGILITGIVNLSSMIVKFVATFKLFSAAIVYATLVLGSFTVALTTGSVAAQAFFATLISLPTLFASIAIGLTLVTAKILLMVEGFKKVPDNKRIKVNIVGGKAVIDFIDVAKTDLEKLDENYTIFVDFEDRSTLQALLDRIQKEITNVLPNLLQGVISIVSSITSVVGSIVGGAVKMVSDLLSDLSDKLQNIPGFNDLSVSLKKTSADLLNFSTQAEKSLDKLLLNETFDNFAFSINNFTKRAETDLSIAASAIDSFGKNVERVFKGVDKVQEETLDGKNIKDVAEDFKSSLSKLKDLDEVLVNVNLDTNFDFSDADSIKLDFIKVIENSGLSESIQTSLKKELNKVDSASTLQEFNASFKNTILESSREILEPIIKENQRALSVLTEQRDEIFETLKSSETGSALEASLRGQFAEIEATIRARKAEFNELLISLNPKIEELQGKLDEAKLSGDKELVDKLTDQLVTVKKEAIDGVNLLGKTISKGGNAFNQQFEITTNSMKAFLNIVGDNVQITEEKLETLLKEITSGVELGVVDVTKAINFLNISTNTINLSADQRRQIEEKTGELLEIQLELNNEQVETLEDQLELKLAAGQISQEEFDFESNKISQLEIENQLIEKRGKLKAAEILRQQGAEEEIAKQRADLAATREQELKNQGGQLDELTLKNLKAQADAINLQEKNFEGLKSVKIETLQSDITQLELNKNLLKLKAVEIKSEEFLAQIRKESEEEDRELAEEKTRREIEINRLKLIGATAGLTDRKAASDAEKNSAAELANSRDKISKLLEKELELKKLINQLEKEGLVDSEQFQNANKKLLDFQNQIKDEKQNQLELNKQNLSDQLNLINAIESGLIDEVNKRLELNKAVQEYKSALIDAKDIQNELRAQLIALQQSTNQLGVVKIGVQLTGLDAIDDLQNQLNNALPGSDEEQLLKNQIAEVKEVADINNTGENDRINLIKQRQSLEAEIRDTEFEQRMALIDIENERAKIAIDTANFELEAALEIAKIRNQELNNKSSKSITDAKERLGLLNSEKEIINEIVLDNTLRNATDEERQEFLEEGLDSLNEQYGTNIKDLDILNQKFGADKDREKVQDSLVDSIAERTDLSKEEIENSLDLITNLETENKLSNQGVKNAEKLIKNNKDRKSNLDKINDAQKDILLNQKEGQEAEDALNNLLEVQKAQRQGLIKITEQQTNQSFKLSRLEDKVFSFQSSVEEGSKDFTEVLENKVSRDLVGSVGNDLQRVSSAYSEAADAWAAAVKPTQSDIQKLTQSNSLLSTILNFARNNDIPISGVTDNQPETFIDGRSSSSNTAPRTFTSSPSNVNNTEAIEENTDALNDATSAWEGFQNEAAEANRLRREAAGIFDESDQSAQFRVQNEVFGEIGSILNDIRDDKFETEIIGQLFEQGKITKQMAMTLLGVESGVTRLSDDEIVEAIVNGDVTKLIQNQEALESDGGLFIDPITGQLIATGEVPNFDGLNKLVELIPEGEAPGSLSDWFKTIQASMIEGVEQPDGTVDGLVGIGTPDQITSLDQLPSYEDSRFRFSNGALKVVDINNPGVTTSGDFSIEGSGTGSTSGSFTRGGGGSSGLSGSSNIDSNDPPTFRQELRSASSSGLTGNLPGGAKLTPDESGFIFPDGSKIYLVGNASEPIAYDNTKLVARNDNMPYTEENPYGGSPLWLRNATDKPLDTRTLSFVHYDEYKPLLNELIKNKQSFFSKYFTTDVTPRAEGGSVEMGQHYLVGEEGPELFVPGQNGQIIPNGGVATPVNTPEIVNELTESFENLNPEIKKLYELAEDYSNEMKDLMKLGSHDLVGEMNSRIKDDLQRHHYPDNTINPEIVQFNKASKAPTIGLKQNQELITDSTNIVSMANQAAQDDNLLANDLFLDLSKSQFKVDNVDDYGKVVAGLDKIKQLKDSVYGVYNTTLDSQFNDPGRLAAIEQDFYEKQGQAGLDMVRNRHKKTFELQQKRENVIAESVNIYNNIIQNPNQFGSTQLVVTQSGG